MDWFSACCLFMVRVAVYCLLSLVLRCCSLLSWYFDLVALGLQFWWVGYVVVCFIGLMLFSLCWIWVSELGFTLFVVLVWFGVGVC